MGTDLDTVLRIRQSVAALGRGNWLLAVSGGMDSMVLLDAAVETLDHQRLTVATFDHRTGRAARTAAALVAERSLELGVGCVSGAADATDPELKRSFGHESGGGPSRAPGPMVERGHCETLMIKRFDRRIEENHRVHSAGDREEPVPASEGCDALPNSQDGVEIGTHSVKLPARRLCGTKFTLTRLSIDATGTFGGRSEWSSRTSLGFSWPRRFLHCAAVAEQPARHFSHAAFRHSCDVVDGSPEAPQGEATGTRSSALSAHCRLRNHRNLQNVSWARRVFTTMRTRAFSIVAILLGATVLAPFIPSLAAQESY